MDKWFVMMVFLSLVLSFANIHRMVSTSSPNAGLYHRNNLTVVGIHSTNTVRELQSMASFVWVGGADINGFNNWTTPANWTVGGVPATTFPNSPADDVSVNSDVSAANSIISGGTSITVSSLGVGNPGVPGINGGHVIVGGSSDIGGGGGGTLTSTGVITVASSNAGGGLVGGIGGVINAPVMTLTAPGVVIGGGGTFNIPTINNNGEIQADGGNFNLGPVVLNSTTISGTGFIEVDGQSTVEINAVTGQTVNIGVTKGQTGTVIYDLPAGYTGTLDLLNPNSSANLFFKGVNAAGVTFDQDNHHLVVTDPTGAVVASIPFVSSGTVGLSVVPSTMAGYGEVVISPTNTGILPNIPPPVNGVSTTTLSSSELSDLLQDNQSAMRFVSGTEAVVVVDGVLSVGPDTNEAFVTRLYKGLLGRAPDLTGLSGLDAAVATSGKTAIAQAFLNNPQFQAAHPAQDDAGFVTTMYQGFLGRAPEAGAVKSWTGAIAAGMSRAQVAALIGDSAEAKQHWAGVTSDGVFAYDPSAAVIREDYQLGFGRDADTPSLAALTSYVHAGGTLQDVARSISLTQEFQSLHGSQTDQQYVDSLYLNGLGRAADPAGEAAWVGALQSGVSRSDVMGAIAQSAEGQAHVHWALTA